MIEPWSLGPLLLVLGSTLAAQEGEWPYFGGDRTFKRYSQLDRIDASNVGDLRIVWRRPGLEPELKEEFPELRPGQQPADRRPSWSKVASS